MNPDFEKQELIPAIVQDYSTKQVLMLAYANKESYEYMLKNKETCFYSRSRQELWHKGETSGHFQKIKEMKLDCDRDTLLILVEQIGVACHTGSLSCFFNNVGADLVSTQYHGQGQTQENDIIENVYNMIKERENDPKDGSYTNYLLNQGIDKICKKVGEEATETIIAAKNADKDELVGEISDLVYHTLVLMFNKGVTIQDIKEKLSQRHRIEGNKKIENRKGEF